MEEVDGTWICYGLGNQIARREQPTGLTEEGVIAWFSFTERGKGHWDVRPRFEPTLLTIPPDAVNVGTAAPPTTPTTYGTTACWTCRPRSVPATASPGPSGPGCGWPSSAPRAPC